MKKILLIILGVMGAAGLTRVQAQILNVNFIDDSINVDYGGGNNPVPAAMSGAGVIGSSGDIWNGLGGFAYATYPSGATFTSGYLQAADGTFSGITVSLWAPSGTYDANSPGFSNHSPFSWASLADENGNIGYPYTSYAALMASCLVANSTATNGFVTLSGLIPNAFYTIYTYNASDQNETSGRTSTFTVNGTTLTSTYDGATTNLVSGVDYLEFPGVAASASGTLTITFGNLGVSESDFNGFQLQSTNGFGPPPHLAPSVSTVSPNNIILCTNTALSCTATSSNGTITNVELIIATSALGGTSFTTNTTNLVSPAVTGLGTATATINYPLTSNLIYNVTVVATDNAGTNSSASKVSFDTISPTLVIEAEDFNYSGGQFTNTPPDGGLALYAYAPLGVSEIDLQKNPSGGSQSADGSYYRSGDVIINGYAAPVNGTEQKYVTAAAAGDTTDVPIEVGYNSVGDWLDYTRTFGSSDTNSAPDGTYYVWSRLATDGSGAALNFYQITAGQGTVDQTSNQLGSFSFTDNNWNGFDYVPMVDQFGNLVSVTLSGQETFRSTVVGNPNIDFYMLVPAVPILTPSLRFAYPDGLHPFEATNNFAFTIGPANGSNIVSSGIDLVLNGVDVTSNPKFTLTASGTSWTASYPVASNAVYVAVINVTNTAGLSSTFTINFDTFNINNFQWEAADYDFSTNGTTGGLFIDNPVPSCDITAPQKGELATNSYYAYPEDLVGVAIALQGVDIGWADTQPIANNYYRNDGVGTEPSGDYVRPQFVAAQQQFNDPNIGPFQIGYFNGGNWLNYTRHYPTNNFYVWSRLAGGAGPFSGTLLSMVTSGYGTSLQTSNVLGSFADPNASGWEAYHWIQMLDSNGTPATVSLGGLATLTLTSGNNLNAGFFMLVPAPASAQLVPSVVGGQLNLSFATQVGHTYTVVYKSDLTSPTWTPVGSPITGTGSSTNVTEALSGTQGFYTIGVQ